MLESVLVFFSFWSHNCRHFRSLGHGRIVYEHSQLCVLLRTSVFLWHIDAAGDLRPNEVGTQRATTKIWRALYCPPCGCCWTFSIAEGGLDWTVDLDWMFGILFWQMFFSRYLVVIKRNDSSSPDKWKAVDRAFHAPKVQVDVIISGLQTRRF